ncbi:GNAT family N-acetyltransferase [Roseovarius atlanticus]|uniref:GNAT family N-acetyltransferase n=1 Tax=Roseovarius atlanticus TaxID=1641875 RepID=UPI001C946593|nr:GNAT family N-acetyltransferase [Roseovarius atlanticus]MBY5988126.1 GNAT family N-acetyltransferase [Roseovarius atlanticus]MBY6123517.1 GNAT family N-acetyltransferase [Roseovarius atlanticus]MBY6148012.1 GNAT family N-acetyltransferase [Roseovarius atlanticus]
MKIRPAEAGDAKALAGIVNHYIRETTVSFTEDEKTVLEMALAVKTRDEAGHGFLVAEGDGDLLGYATYGPYRNGSGYRETLEHTVLLRAGVEGKGVGRALMAALEDHARAGGVHSLIGGISAENAGGIAFHRRIGFVEVGRVAQAGLKFGRRIDLVLMQKLLSPGDRTP